MAIRLLGKSGQTGSRHAGEAPGSGQACVACGQCPSTTERPRCRAASGESRQVVGLRQKNNCAAAGFRDPQYAEAGCRDRSEEHTSELQSLMRISYAVFCLKKKKKTPQMST